MRAVVERVSGAAVSVKKEEVSRTGAGLLVLLGIAGDDTEKDIAYIVEKVMNLRVFTDEGGKLNLSVKDVEGQIMLVSQFTLMGDARHGRRPSYTAAASPEAARAVYEKTVNAFLQAGADIKTGVFQADMQVSHVNNGPVTILLDSRKLF